MSVLPRGMYDWRCDKCGKRFGTTGVPEDLAVTCPKCNHRMDVSKTVESLRKTFEMLDKGEECPRA